MTEKRDESRDLLVNGWGNVRSMLGVSFTDVLRDVTGSCDRNVLAQYSPTCELESVMRERDAAVRRVAELEAALLGAVDNRSVSALESLFTEKEPSDA